MSTPKVTRGRSGEHPQKFLFGELFFQVSLPKNVTIANTTGDKRSAADLTNGLANLARNDGCHGVALDLVEAFPFDTAPKYLLRDRDRIYGFEFHKQVEAMGIKEVLSALRSPWQRAYVERVLGPFGGNV